MNLTSLNKQDIHAIKFENNTSKLISESFQSALALNTTNLKKLVVNQTQEKSSLNSKNKSMINDKQNVSKRGESKQETGEEEWKIEQSFDGEFDVKYPNNMSSSLKMYNQTLKPVNNSSKNLNLKKNASTVSSNSKQKQIEQWKQEESFDGEFEIKNSTKKSSLTNISKQPVKNKSKTQNLKKNSSNFTNQKGKKNVKEVKKNQAAPKVFRVDLQKVEIPLKSRESKNLSKNQNVVKAKESKNKTKQQVVKSKNASKKSIPKPINASLKQNVTKKAKKNNLQFIPLKMIEPENIRPQQLNQTKSQKSKITAKKKFLKKKNLKKSLNKSKKVKKNKKKNQKRSKKTVNKKKNNTNKQIKSKKIVQQVINNEPFVPIKEMDNQQTPKKNKISSQIPVKKFKKKQNSQKNDQKQAKNLSKSKQKSDIIQGKSEPIPIKTFKDELIKNKQKETKQKIKVKSWKNKKKANKIKNKKDKQKSLKKKSKQQKQLKNSGNSESVPFRDPFKRQIKKERKRVVQPNPDYDFAPIKKQQRQPKQDLWKKFQKKFSVNVPKKVAPNTPVPVKDNNTMISKPTQEILKKEATNYVPSQDESADIIKITGITYIPVVKSQNNIKLKHFQFKKNTYIPNKDYNIIIIGGRKYMAATLLKPKKPQKAKIQEKKHKKQKKNKIISSKGNQNKQYVPIKTFDAPKKIYKNVSIKINDNYYVPIKNSKHKTIQFDGVRYLPVKELDDSVKVKNPIKSNQKGHINVLKINGQSYIPLSAIPPKYNSVFKIKKENKANKKKVKKAASPSPKKLEKTVIPVKNQSPLTKNYSSDYNKIGQINYIPVNDSNAEPIKIDGKIYIPVIKSPQNKFHKVFHFNGKKYSPMRNKDAIIIGGRKYFPVIPIISKKAKKVVKQININKNNSKQSKTLKSSPSSLNKQFVPIKNFDHTKKKNASLKVFNKKQSSVKKTLHPINANKKKLNPKQVSDKLQKKQKKSSKMNKSKKYEPVPIRNFKIIPIQIDGKTLVAESQPVKMGEHLYIPFKLNDQTQNFKQQKLEKLEIKKNKAVKLNGVYYKTVKQTPVIIIGNSYYIPVKKLTTPSIKIQGKRYIPLINGTAKPVSVQGKTYIPIQEANQEQIESSIPIVHKNQKKIKAIRIGKITYVPIRFIPKVYRPVYNKKSEVNQKKWANQPRLVININNQNYVPITNSSLKVVKFNNIKYIPVYHAPHNKSLKLKTVNPTKTGKIETINVDGITYIPINVIPYEHRRDFKPKKRVLPSTNAVIEINKNFFVPLNNNKVKPVEIEGVVYIPVKQANSTQLKKSKKIKPQKESQAEALTIGGQSYIPINIIPKLYVPIFKNKFASLKNQSIPTHVIKINNQDFIPHKQMKSIFFNGNQYYPVKLANEDIVDELKPVKPTIKGEIAILRLSNVTYIPASVVPKAFKKVFRPINKTNKIVLLIDGNHYVPIKDKNVQPITIRGKQYIPVKPSKGKLTQNTKILASKQNHQLQKIKLGKQTYTYIPIDFIPKNYRQILETKSEIPNYPSHSIKINSQRFVPITNQTVKPINLNGKKYIPVYTAPKKNSGYLQQVEPTQNQKFDIVRIQNINYIPEEAIPKEYVKIFKPVNKIITKPYPVVKIGSNNYVPLFNKSVRPIRVKGQIYTPVERKIESKNQSEKEIIIKIKENVKIMKIGNNNYLPASAIPKLFRKSFQVSPKKAVELEKNQVIKPQKQQKKAIKQTKSPIKAKRNQSKPKLQKDKVKPKQKITQFKPKQKKAQVKPKSQKKKNKLNKKSKKQQNKIIPKPQTIKQIKQNQNPNMRIKNQSNQINKTSQKRIEKVNIETEIQKLEELINRKNSNKIEPVPIITKEKLSKYNVKLNQEAQNIVSDKSKTDQQQMKALKQINSSFGMQSNCKCNLDTLNITSRACFCEGQNAKVQISYNKSSLKTPVIPLSLIVSINPTQSLQNKETIDKKNQIHAPISQIIQSISILPIQTKSQVVSSTNNHVV